jgi:hypothetical protein
VLLGSAPQRRKLISDAVPSIFVSTATPSADRVTRQVRCGRLHTEVGVFDVQVDNDPVNISQQILFDEFIADGPTAEWKIGLHGSTNVSIIPDAEAQAFQRSTQTDWSSVSTASIAIQTGYRPLLTLLHCSTNDKIVHCYASLESYCNLKFLLSTLGPAAYCLLKYMVTWPICLLMINVFSF